MTGYDYTSWSKTDPEFQESILQVIDYMRDSGWITYITDKTQCPMNIRLTPLGIDVVEKNLSPTQASQTTTFNIATNYGVAASTASHITINTGTSFEELHNLVKEMIPVSQEQLFISSTIEKLEAIIDANKPIEKGVLSAISPFLKKHSWLSGPIASLLLQYAVKLVK